MKITIRNLLLSLALMCAWITATAEIDFLSKADQNSWAGELASPEFVPVEKAYSVNVVVEDKRLLLNWTIRDGYYLYRDRFKFGSMDNNAVLAAPQFANGLVKWDEYFEKELEVYYQQTSVVLPFTTDATRLNLKIESQGCADAGLCYPPYKQWLDIDLINGTVEISSQPPAANNQPDNIGDRASLPLALVLLFALAGGMILNLMPCVFPILSIKVLSFTMNHKTDRSRHIHGLVYTAGVISSFVAIAIAMLTLRAAGESIGWGFQLQSPLFVIFLIYLFFVMGLGLSGYLEIGSGLMSVGQNNQNEGGLRSSFMTGVLATTVASPCTAPFMGPALGFAISQSSSIAVLVFAFLGLGMALPFILLAWIPGLTKRLPKPGPWMDVFKQFLAFPIYMTAVWLLWVAGRQTSIDVAAAVIIGLILLVMALWMWKLNSKPVTRLIAAALFAAALAVPVAAISESNLEPEFLTYSPELLAELRDDNQPVFINLTADWCITCLVNERVALSSEKVIGLMGANGISYLKGDWTNSDPQITELLGHFNRSGVPLYLLYPRGQGEAVILPQILTESMVIDALNQAIN
ncbi:Thiol:disulfide interchange protein DsbD precursor [Gammaproteobacteria bacterium MOLA455]|nr:Thiol:disulfide interchange protein DsbD precursor [Gammaproteobacteria bacterium MOLA455]